METLNQVTMINSTMSTVLWLAAWWALMLVPLVFVRLITSRQQNKIKFDPSGNDLDGLAARITRVTCNNYENIPLFIGVLLAAQLLGLSEITDQTACWLLYARIGQSLAHLISGSRNWVLVRFAFYIAQWALVSCYVVQLLMAVY